MPQFFTKTRIAIVVFLIATTIIGCRLSQTNLPTNPVGFCSELITVSEFNSWFETGSVSLNGSVKPANSLHAILTPNCGFYKWSSQMFLWITSPSPPRYKSKDLVMNSPIFYDVSPAGSDGRRTFIPHRSESIRPFTVRSAQRGILDLPVVFENATASYLEVLPELRSSKGNQLVLDGKGIEREIGKLVLNKGDIPQIIDVDGREIENPTAIFSSSQAQDTSGFLARLKYIKDFDISTLVQKIEQDGRAFFIDKKGKYHRVEQGQADSGILIAQNGSLVYYTIMVNNVYVLQRSKVGANNPTGLKFPTTQAEINSLSSFAMVHGQSPIIDSQALAVEIKASWIESAGLENPNDFIKMEAIVPTYDKSNPIDWKPNGTKKVELAMVGMHVVGSTLGHPEMLWATFEHVSNCPNAAYSYQSNDRTNVRVPLSTAGNWLFCADRAMQIFNLPKVRFMENHIKATPGYSSISASNIVRMFPWGFNEDASSDNADLVSLNNKIQSLLIAGDVRKNYIQIGTTWIQNGEAPSATNRRGSPALSNATMETFLQAGTCFYCHASNTVDISHVFRVSKPLY